MSEPALILLVSESQATVPVVRRALESGGQEFLLQHVERARTASARIAGGGVGLVLVDVSGVAVDSRRGDAFQTLRAGMGEIPLVVLCDGGDEGVAAQMVQDGAFQYVLRSEWPRNLQECVLAAMAPPEVPAPGSERKSGRRGTVVTVLGAKGGVGATTVAVNVASTLAATSKVILAELRPPFGNLCQIFRPHRATRTLQHLLDGETNPQEVELCLWPNRNIPGLSVLFAAEKALSAQELEAERAGGILRTLTELCDVVVIDLSPSLSEANQAILARSDTLIFVLERDVLSVDAAKAKLGALEAAGIVPQEAGSVIVNRVALAAPLALADIESQLGIPTFAVIPPAADLCAAAYRVHMPVVKLDADSSLATSLVNLAKRFPQRSVESTLLRS